MRASKLRNYAESLWWESIPMEMLYTPVMKPQVRVQVNGLDAVCPDQNCDYLYKENLSEDSRLRRNLEGTPQVQSFSYNADSKEVTIEGENFEDRECTEGGAVVATFADQSCAINSQST